MPDVSESSVANTSTFLTQDAADLPAMLTGKGVDLQQVITVVFATIMPLYAIDHAAIHIYDKDRSVIAEAITANYDAGTEAVSISVSIDSKPLSSLQMEIASYTFPVIQSTEESHLCYLPLESSNRILGTLELHHQGREFTAECLTFCSSIADILSSLIDLQQCAVQSSNVISGTAMSGTDKSSTEVGEPAVSDADLSATALADLPNQTGLLEQIGEAESLHDFLDRAAAQFPALFGGMKTELEEIIADGQQGMLHHPDLPEEPATTHYPGIIGDGKAMRTVFALINQVADSASTVLILGESGTGKELIAKAIHEQSARRDKTMISINCAAIPANLMESELFGHEKGSFTGATDQRLGKFELADNSTLFLDEIGELPPELQVKLLRALQEKEIERVGGKSVIRTNVRIISATNRDLLKEVEQGRFRRDLYYRLNVFPISLPPLRERREDIPLLATHFLNKFSKHPAAFSRSAIRQLSKYDWPGNVREMEHLIERQVLLSGKPLISHIDIPVMEKTIKDEKGVAQVVKTIDENERDHIFAVLQLCKGRISGAEGAAKLLGVPATTLNSKIKRLGLNKKHF